MKQQNSLRLRLIVNACPRCGGTAYLEDPHEDEWRCLQCARAVPSPIAIRRGPTAA
jgi:ribosomal protein S27AE